MTAVGPDALDEGEIPDVADSKENGMAESGARAIGTGNGARSGPSRASGRGEEQASGKRSAAAGKAGWDDPCIRAENEDDDGYDPYSDRRPVQEPLFERDPWD